MYICVPELKDRTLEEVNELFAARVSARKFSGHKCATHEDIIRNASEQKGAVAEVIEIEDIGSGTTSN
jgi:hypothetical protein